MKKFFQKHIAKASQGLHQQLVLLNQDEDGRAAIDQSELAQLIVKADFNPWSLTISELGRFKRETEKIQEETVRLRDERLDKVHRHFRQLYLDTRKHFVQIPGLKYSWNSQEHRAEFSIGGSVQLSFGCNEHDLLYCISILENLQKAHEAYTSEVADRAKQGVVSPSTQHLMAIEQTDLAYRARLYALIGYDVDRL